MNLHSRIAAAERSIRERDIRQLSEAVGETFETMSRMYAAVEYIFATEAMTARSGDGVSEDAPAGASESGIDRLGSLG